MDTPDRLILAAQALTRLTEIANTPDERPQLIRDARDANVSWAVIVEAAHLSRAHVSNLAKIGAPDTP